MPATAFDLHSKSFINLRYADLLAPVAGIVMALSFSPFNYGYLAFFALAFMFASWEVSSPARAAFRGFLFGLGLFGFGVSWVFVSIRVYGGADLFSSVLITLLFVSVWSLFPALTGYLANQLTRGSDRLSNGLIPPCVWILIECVRGNWFLSGFPWLQIAYSQLNSPLSGYVPIIGVYGAGFVMAMAASLTLQCRHNIRLTGINLAIIASLFAAGAMLKNTEWTHPIGKPLQVSLLQGNIPQEQKWAPENRDATLRKYRMLTEQHWDSDIIVWPETSIPAYYAEVKESYLEPLNAEAIAHNTAIIVSLPMQGEPENVKYNAVMVLGNSPGIYKKNHLLPFGEYLPLQPLSGKILALLNMRLGQFTPGGDDQALPAAAGFRFAASICYEDAISRETTTKLPNAAFLVNVTNDAWFGRSIEPFQHLQIARMRALEVGRYLLRAANTGVTAIIAPSGDIVKQAPPFETGAIIGTITPLGGQTLYAQLGDTPVILMLIVLLIPSLLTQIKFSRRIKKLNGINKTEEALMNDWSQSEFASSTDLFKIDVKDLRVGMYVSKLDRPWLETNFLFQGFELKNENDIDVVQQHCEYVYIDVTKQSKAPPIYAKSTAYSKDFLEKHTPPEKRSTFAKEIKNAEYVHHKTSHLVKSFMEGVSLGQTINTELAKKAVAECVESIINTPDALMWMTQLKKRDEYTAQHSMNVCIYSIALGRHINLPVAELHHVGLCGMMHDMGKMKIPLVILNKPGKFTPEELKIMQSHTTLGWKLLTASPGMYGGAIDVAHAHHEKLDGTGYPRNLKAEHITPYARIVAIADMYDAITSDRVYQNGRAHLEAISILTQNSGSHLDDSLTIKFIECLGIYPSGSIVELNNGEVGIVVEVNPKAKIRPKIILLLDENKQPRPERLIDLAKLDLEDIRHNLC